MDSRCMMLTGDNKTTAQWGSEQIGLDVVVIGQLS